jgi:dUTP pyrophosphatase
MKVKIKKLSPDAVIPTYKHDGDAGFDLKASKTMSILPGQTIKIPTGLAFDIPKGYEMQVRPRSGISAKTPLLVIMGTIDSGYHGEVSIIAYLRPSLDSENGERVIIKGTRIAQAVIAPVIHANFEEVDELEDSERGTAGFGSTGVKQK